MGGRTIWRNDWKKPAKEKFQGYENWGIICRSREKDERKVEKSKLSYTQRKDGKYKNEK